MTRENMQAENLTARGSEEPYSVQFSIFLANRVGQLRDLLDLFGPEDLQLLGLSVVDSTSWAVVRAVFSDTGLARELLTRNGLPFTETDVLLVEMPTGDSLARISGHLLQAEINIHFAYSLSARSHGYPVMVLHVEDPVLARQILVRHGFAVIGHEDMTN
jgi:hypothetical protein